MLVVHCVEDLRLLLGDSACWAQHQRQIDRAILVAGLLCRRQVQLKSRVFLFVRCMRIGVGQIRRKSRLSVAYCLWCLRHKVFGFLAAVAEEDLCDEVSCVCEGICRGSLISEYPTGDMSLLSLGHNSDPRLNLRPHLTLTWLALCAGAVAHSHDFAPHG